MCEFENLKIREKNSIRDLLKDGIKQKILFFPSFSN